MASLKDPGLWSALIALLALVLSQLPPVKQMLKRRALQIVVPEYIALYHFLGNLNLMGFISLFNTGGKGLTVAKIDAVVSTDDTRWHVPGATYVSREPSASGGQSRLEFFVGWNALKPGEHWSQTVHFFRAWTVQEEEDAAEIVGKIRTDINAKLAQRAPAAQGLVEADESLVKEAKALVDQRFKLVKGNYRLVIAALSEKDELLSLQGFEFTLFDNHIKTLRSIVDDYKFGAGIYFPSPDWKQVFVRLRPLAQVEARREYSKAG